MKRLLYKTSLTGNTNVKKLEVLRRREQVYQLHLEGKNQTQISELTQIPQPTISRDLQALQKEAVSYVYSLARGKIASKFKEATDSLSSIKRRCYNLIDSVDQAADNDTINAATKVKLINSILKTLITAEEAKYRIIADAENVLNIESLSQTVSEIEQQYKEAFIR